MKPSRFMSPEDTALGLLWQLALEERSSLYADSTSPAARADPWRDHSDHQVLLGEEWWAPLLFAVVCVLACVLPGLAHMKWQSAGGPWGACRASSPRAAPLPAAPRPGASPLSRAIQRASALTFTGVLWLWCLEHIILMGRNQINSKPHLSSTACEDSGNSVCCLPGSPHHANLWASSTCYMRWEPRN